MLAWLKSDVVRLLRLRLTAAEWCCAAIFLCIPIYLAYALWHVSPSESLWRYEGAVEGFAFTAHFPQDRDDLPPGSRFYRGIRGGSVALYTPNTVQEAQDLIAIWGIGASREEEVLRQIETFGREVLPPDPDRAGAVWRRVSGDPDNGLLWCDPATGEIVYVGWLN